MQDHFIPSGKRSELNIWFNSSFFALSEIPSPTREWLRPKHTCLQGKSALCLQGLTVRVIIVIVVVMTRCTLHVARCTLHVTRDTLHVTHDTLHVTRYTWHMIRGTLRVTCGSKFVRLKDRIREVHVTE